MRGTEIEKLGKAVALLSEVFNWKRLSHGEITAFAKCIRGVGKNRSFKIIVVGKGKPAYRRVVDVDY